MASKQRLERRIASTEDMASIVSTMKALAAVNVRVFGKARDAIERYGETIERALQVALAEPAGLEGGSGGGASLSGEAAARAFASGALGGPAGSREADGVGLFVVGAVQGMCGQFTEHIASSAIDYADRFGGPVQCVAIGPRAGARLAERGMLVERSVPMRGSLESLAGAVDDCIVAMDQLRRRGIRRAVVFYNTEGSQASYEPHHELILPVSEAWIGRIARRAWPTRQRPVSLTPRPGLVGSLARQYLFASFYRAAAQSLASENAARLASMQNAESNIDERLEELQSAYNQQRQQEITSELLDIVGGYTALRDE